MYNKVPTNMNFVEREKERWRSSGKMNEIFEKSIEDRKKGDQPIPSMMDRRPQTASRTSVMC